ncbi:MAG: hypothetical protein NTY77_05740 [Elusimicrobia bacterium]|nr:hypothetical protein [Elusimicrobiota bacterium]
MLRRRSEQLRAGLRGNRTVRYVWSMVKGLTWGLARWRPGRPKI